MNTRSRRAAVALSCILLFVASCDGSDPVQPGSPVSVVTQTLPEAIEGVEYSEELAGAGGSGGYGWTVASGALPAGLGLSAGGRISGTPVEPGRADFQVRVTDAAGQSATAALSIEVTGALSIGTGSLVPAVRGEPYSAQLNAAGGRGTYVWSLGAGGGPAWLSVSVDGLLSGTPATAGPATVSVAVTDASGQQATTDLALTVLEPLVVTTATLPGAVQGRAFGVQLEAGGGDGTYTWDLSGGSLPAGLDLTPGGVILGAPVGAGVHGFTVRVTDAGGRTATRPLTLTVEAAPTIQTEGLPAARPGEAYSAQLQATGGTGSFTWSLSEGALPAGLTLSATGLISGVPTTLGTTPFTVRVSDAAGAAHTRAFSITVTEATALQNGVPLSGLSGEEGSASYFFIQVPAGVAELVVSMAGGTGDADLYVRHAALPQLFSYDCRPFREGNQETCTFTPPAAGPWYVMIRGYSAYAGVTLTASYEG